MSNQKKRAQIKGQLTRFVTFLSAYRPEQAHQLQARLEGLEPLLEEFNNVQFEIESVDTDDQYVIENGEERIQFENKYYEAVGEAKKLLRVLNTSTPIVNATVLNETAIGPKIRLPTLNLPTFTGKYDEWQQFKDNFQACINENANLTNSQRFRYLLPQLKDEALKVVDSLEITDDNYSIAWDILTKRFENKRFTVNNHIRAMLDIPVLSKENHKQLRELSDILNRSVRCLKTLKVPVDTWDCILVFIISNKFDATTRKEWEGSIKAGELATLQEMLDFLNGRCSMLEALKLQDGTVVNSSNAAGKKYVKAGSYAATVVDNECLFCNANHSLSQCMRFKAQPIESRLEAVKNLRLCYCCLKKGHRSYRCRAPKCRTCNRPHHDSLHLTSNTESQRAAVPVEAKRGESPLSQPLLVNAGVLTAAATAHGSAFTERTTLLNTADINVVGPDGRKNRCRVMLDSGAQANFVTKELCELLGIKGTPIDSVVHGVGDGTIKIRHKVNLTIKSRITAYQESITCLVLPAITGYMPAVSFDADIIEIPEDIELADDSYYQCKEIQMLLGIDVFYNVLCAERRYLGKNMPVLQRTLFGWTLGGTLYIPPKQTTGMFAHCALEASLERFWKQEELETPRISKEELECEDIFIRTTTRDAQGRFIVDLPLKEGACRLGNSRGMAEKRFFTLERRLIKNPELGERYGNFMKEYLQLGHMSRLNESSCARLSFYLPHHAVVKESSLSTQTRIVFDGSAAVDGSLSLNDVLMLGPQIQSELFSILARFRKYKFVLCADVQQMFRQILLNNDHTHLQRILWRSRPEEGLDTYVLRTVTYGLKSSPWLATRVLKQIALDNRARYPFASAVLENDFYMDDLLSGTDSIENARQLRSDLTEILKTAGMNLRKWLTNDDRIINESEKENNEHLKIISVAENETNKTLGILWNPRKDTLQYSVNLVVNNREADTKRQILSRISQVYDPLGLISPVIVIAKLLMQSLWENKISWDEKVNSVLQSRWTDYESKLPLLKDIRIPRRILCNKAVRTELHGFCDSSERAYGAAIYIKSVDTQGDATVRLLCAKSRIAPLKKISLPKLELNGAVLLARLANRIIQELRIDIDVQHYWCDSTVVLCWISSDSGRWQTFVANRVSEIQALTVVNNWHHVRSKDNAADILSRGCSPEDLKNCKIWWQGPDFLKKDIDLQLPTKLETMKPEQCPEARKIIMSLCVMGGATEIFKRYSSVDKMLRILSYCFRFFENCRLGLGRITGLITPEEIERTLRRLIKVAQQQSLSNEIKDLAKGSSLKAGNKLIALNPFIDDFGLIRVGGRLQKTELAYESKHPIILPAHHDLTFLIARDVHEKELHCGAQALLATLRLKYWPVAGRNLVKQVVYRCVRCFRAKPKGILYPMGQLPRERVVPTPPFYHTGCDFAGPYLLRDKKTRGCKNIKCYVCIFVCFVTKAVHIELVGSLTTEAFLATLRRFIGRRGTPHTIYTDNATNFIGARNELLEIKTFLEGCKSGSKVNEHLTERGVNWKFLPPRAPHFGGLHEAAVKSMKFHLKRVAGTANLVFEEFYTLLVQIEAVMNSRPLYPMSSNPEDFSPLTPGHFLIGRPVTAMLDHDLRYESSNRLSHYQRVQQLLQHFWSRWQREYLTGLQQRKKWHGNSTESSLRPGAVVVIMEDNAPPCKWHLGRVEELHPGTDGVSRVATIRTGNGLFKRTVRKLCLLPILEDEIEADQHSAMVKCVLTNHRSQGHLSADGACDGVVI